MKKKSIIALSMAMLLAIPYSVAPLNVSNIYADTYESEDLTEGETDNGIKWALDDDGILTLSGKGAIDDNYFSGRDDISKVIIKNGITSIGQSAFSSGTCIQSVTIADSVTSINDDAFSGCNSITTVKMSKNIKTIGDNAFFNCSVISKIKIYEGASSIGHNAFSGCDGMSVIEIPASVKTIGENAFEACEDLTIYGATGSKVEGYAKEYSISFVKVKNLSKSGVKISASKYDYDGKIKTPKVTVKYGKTTLKNNTDYYVEYSSGRKNIGKYTVKVTGTGKYSGTFKLTYTINLGAKKTYTVNGLKYKVTNSKSKTPTFTVTGSAKGNIKTTTIPEKITVGGKKFVVDKIAASAFKRRTHLTSVTISKNIKEVGKSAFEGCSNLADITVKTTALTNKTVGANAFKSIKSNATITVPASKYIVYKNLLKAKGANKANQKFKSR